MQLSKKDPIIKLLYVTPEKVCMVAWAAQQCSSTAGGFGCPCLPGGAGGEGDMPEPSGPPAALAFPRFAPVAG